MLGLKRSHSLSNVNLWIVPLKMSVAAFLLFGITITIDTLAANHVIHLPDWFSMGSIEDARAILSAMLGCVSTVLALIFSVSLLVLSMVATLFGPRLLYRFVHDWVTQTTIGAFLGAFIYVFLVFLVTHEDDHSKFVPQFSLITSWFVVLCAFGFLVYYSHRIAVLIQNPDAIARIVDDIRAAVRFTSSLGGSEEQQKSVQSTASDYHTLHSATVKSQEGGYLQEIDHLSLVDATLHHDARIQILFRPGQFVFPGEPLALVWPAAKGEALALPIRRGVTIGSHRTLTQDQEFGLAQIVEIAIRALSPAVNDTFTGVACVDWLGEALIVLAEAKQSSGNWYSKDGILRLLVRPLFMSRLVKQAFDQIRQAAAENPAVLIRILTTVGRIAPRLTHIDDRVALMAQAAAVWETASANASARMDRDDIEKAWRQTRELLDGLMSSATNASLPSH